MLAKLTGEVIKGLASRAWWKRQGRRGSMEYDGS